MGRDEKVLLTLLFAALAAVIIWRVAPRIRSETAATTAGNVPTNSAPGNGTEGPWYLIYNQPYMFSPPVNNFVMPIQPAGQIGHNAAWDAGQFWSRQYT